MDKETKKPRPAKRRRARTQEGTYKADDPKTSINEAWEPVEAPKVNDYSVKPKITTTGNNTAGKYGQELKLKPTFGKVKTTNH